MLLLLSSLLVPLHTSTLVHIASLTAMRLLRERPNAMSDVWLWTDA